MIENIRDFIENRSLFNKVLKKIEDEGYEKIKIYKSDFSCDSHALCFCVLPKEDTKDPYIKALSLMNELEGKEFLGCQVEVTVKNQFSSEKMKIIEESSIDIMDSDFKEKLLGLYKDITLKPRYIEPPIKRQTSSYLDKSPPPGYKGKNEQNGNLSQMWKTDSTPLPLEKKQNGISKIQENLQAFRKTT